VAPKKILVVFLGKKNHPIQKGLSRKLKEMEN
jgi:hypothetical protein